MPAFLASEEFEIQPFENPLLLIGPSGSGKTVLAMHMAARHQINHADAQQRARDVLYYTAVDFARSYAEAVNADDLAPLRQRLNEIDILVIDDVHLIADKTAAQIELALRIDQRRESGLITIATSRRLPNEVRGMKPTFVSRLLPGLTIPLVNPQGQARRQIIYELASAMQLDFTDDVIDLLDEKLPGDRSVRSLEAALKQVDLWCRMHEKDVCLDAIVAASNQLTGAAEIGIADIASAVARRFRLRLSDLRSESRRQTLVRARSLAMLLARRLTPMSMHQIGEYFGGRDHTTVLHAVRKTESLLEQDNDLSQAADELYEKLSSS